MRTDANHSPPYSRHVLLLLSTYSQIVHVGVVLELGEDEIEGFGNVLQRIQVALVALVELIQPIEHVLLGRLERELNSIINHAFYWGTLRGSA